MGSQNTSSLKTIPSTTYSKSQLPSVGSQLPKKRNWWKWGFIFIIILLVIFFLPFPAYIQPTCKPGQVNCGYWALGSPLFDRINDLFVPRVTDAPVKIPSNLDNSTVTSDETANWKTYIS